MTKESYHLIKFKYNKGVYSLEEMCKFVENNLITEEDFHSITGYNYKGIKERGLT